MINQRLSKKQRRSRVVRDGFEMLQIRWGLLGPQGKPRAACPHEVVIIDLTENYNNFGWRFGLPFGHVRPPLGWVQTLASECWSAATEDRNDFNPDGILHTHEIKVLEGLLTGRAVITFEIGLREGGPGGRVDGLGRFRCHVAFSEAADAERWRKA